jgi:hypothetical protein
MARNKDYTRICKNCGYRWLLHKDWAKEAKPNRLQMGGAKMQAVGDSMRVFSSGAGTRAAQLQAQRDRWIANATCVSCGSTRFAQYKPGKAPPE